MATFSQWQQALGRHPNPRRVTWLCGDERVLVEEVLTYIKKQLEPAVWNYVPLVAGEDSERRIWTEADQHPLGPGNRLVVIRNAEQLQHWERLEEWLQYRHLNPQTFLVFVSNEARLPRTEPTPEQRRKGQKPEMAQHLTSIGTKGHLIECRPYTTATAKHSVKWVQSKVSMREGVAKHLLERSNFNLRLVRDICTKLAVFPGEITLTVINEMLDEQPRDDFPDALLALDKKTALLALNQTSTTDYGRILGLLDARLELAGLVHDLMVERKPQHEIAKAAGAQGFLVKDIIPVAKHYDAKRRLAIRKVLAVADEFYSSGETDGIMEMLVAQW